MSVFSVMARDAAKFIGVIVAIVATCVGALAFPKAAFTVVALLGIAVAASHWHQDAKERAEREQRRAAYKQRRQAKVSDQ